MQDVLPFRLRRAAGAQLLLLLLTAGSALRCADDRALGDYAINATGGRSAEDVPIVVQDFERGPGRQTADRGCMGAGFAGMKPSEAPANCDWPGLSPASCQSSLYCEGCDGFGECLDYLTAEEFPFAGDYSLRIYFDLSRMPTCDSKPGPFGGVIFWLGSSGGTPDKCPGREPADLSNYEALLMQVRAPDNRGSDAEIALKDDSDRETNRAKEGQRMGKVLLSEFADAGRLPGSKWTQVRIPICELIKGAGGNENLNRKAIRALLVGFAREHFVAAGTYVEGLRRLDLDDIVLERCSPSGCSPC